MGDGHHSGSKVGVMDDKVPVGNLWVIALVVIIGVTASLVGLRKGFEGLLDGVVFSQQLKDKDSRLVEVQQQDSKLLAGEAVGEFKPRMSIEEAVKQVGANATLLAPMRPASALGTAPGGDSK